MTVISTTCPQCASAIEFARTDRNGPIQGTCSRCASCYQLSPSGMARLQGRSSTSLATA